MTHDKLPPQAIDLEEAVLGSIMNDRLALLEVSNTIQEHHFYKPQHELIYKAMLSLADKNSPIDMLTVTNHLKESGNLEAAGGVYVIAELARQSIQTSQLAFHAHVILEKWIKRKMIQISSETMSECYNDYDVFEISDKTLKQLEETLKFSDKNEIKIVGKVLREVEEERKNKTDDYLPTGFSSFDKLIAGAKEGQLIIVGGRPGMGKSAFILEVARRVASTSPVLLFSLEMMSSEIVKRMESQIAKISVKNIENDTLSREQEQRYKEASNEIRNSHLYIDDTSSLNIQQLKLKAQRIKSQHGLSCIIVDYLQLCTATGVSNREQEISTISRSLKNLAKDLKVPVFALSQLSRALESRSDKRPQLSDLRESGAIEQDADKVIFLYRTKYYDNTINKDIVEVIAAKNRQGGVGSVNFEFIDYCTAFNETDEVLQDYKPLAPLKHDPFEEREYTPF
jgi:replicative DNA helicase